MERQVYLEKLLVGASLQRQEAKNLFKKILSQQLSEHTIKTVLLLLAQKGEVASEVLGCVQALEALESPVAYHHPTLLDTCGTGGDGSQSLNISTLSAFVIAGAGAKVAKHGNRGLSSPCGSSDLMQALGICLSAGEKKMVQALRECGLGYFHAPYYHPIFAKMQPLRAALKQRTLFNLIGPLVNPVRPKRQLIGVAKPEFLNLYATLLKEKKIHRALLCHSRDGMDEISTRAKSEVILIEKGRSRRWVLDPKTYGFRKPKPEEYRGGNIQHNARAALALLKGHAQGAFRDIVLLNAGAGLYVSGIVKNIELGIEKAAEALESGKAYRVLKELRRLTQTQS